MVDISNNKIAFLENKPKKPKLTIIISIFLLLLISGTYYFKIYDNYLTKGVITCTDTCTLTVSIPSNISFKEIKINNKDFNNLLINQELLIDETNLISYNKLTFQIDGFQDKEIVEVNFYYNKQRIISKIINYMF